MRRYALVSATLFSLHAFAQLARMLFRWPVLVNDLRVPIWPSALAMLVAGGLALWGFSQAVAERPARTKKALTG